MPGLIPQSFIVDLLARVDIIDIVSSRMQLRKAGKDFTALCPFHTEKTPSFTVSQSKQFYYCFGCGAHGNAIGFLMEFDRMEFIDAVETLATHVGLEVPRETTVKETLSSKELYELLTAASNYYQQQLRQADNAISYLKDRGLNGEICKRYNIGYAPPGWDSLLKTLNKNDKLRSQLITTGMLITKESKLYDRFRDRIMFPIRDQRGRVIAFGGRILGTATPKYLNSPETAIFHKGGELYGLFEAKQNNRNLPYIIIVEGYMDVVVLAQHGIDCAVATLGTATSTKHIQKLLRYTTKAVFCFDGDKAGKAAAWRALENALPLMRDGMQALFLFLPDGEDPDSQIRKEGKEAFSDRIKNAAPLSEFFFDQLGQQINLNTMDGCATMAQRASSLLRKMPNGVFQQLMFEKLAKIVRIDAEQLRTIDLNKIVQKQATKQTAKIDLDSPQFPPLVRLAIKLLLHSPELAKHVTDIHCMTVNNIPTITPLVELLGLLKKFPTMTTGAILAHWNERKEAGIFARLAATKIIIPLQNLESEFVGAIERLHEQGREHTIQQLLTKADNGKINDIEKLKLQKLISDAKMKASTD